MDFQRLFNVFSRRAGSKGRHVAPLSGTFRTRVIMRFLEISRRAGLDDEVLNELWKQIAYLLGTTEFGAGENYRDRVLSWLQSCDDMQFLDAIELLFQRDRVSPHALETMVADINEFLQVDGLPYVLTDYVWEPFVEEGRFGQPVEGTRLTQFPRIVRADSQAAYALAIKPALDLLNDGRFSTANAEFLAALVDFRKGEYGDSLTKCTSALESVLKVVLAIRKWPHKDGDSAARLLAIAIEQSGLDGFFKEPLTLIATMRNRLSTAHGGGVQPREVSPAKVEYALNATAAAILLLVRHCLDT